MFIGEPGSRLEQAIRVRNNPSAQLAGTAAKDAFTDTRHAAKATRNDALKL